MVRGLNFPRIIIKIMITLPKVVKVAVIPWIGLQFQKQILLQIREEEMVHLQFYTPF